MVNISNTLLYTGYWAIFGLTHSILASTTIKQKIALDSQYYRILYNIIATISFGLLIWNIPSITSIYLIVPSLPLWKIVLVVTITFLGLAISLWGLTAWDLYAFLGLNQDDSDQLNTGGPYQFSRHPVYSGIILMLSGLVLIEISAASISWLAGCGGYFIIGTIPEEQKLLSHFGEVYQKYRKSTARLFPHRISHIKNLTNIEN